MYGTVSTKVIVLSTERKDKRSTNLMYTHNKQWKFTYLSENVSYFRFGRAKMTHHFLSVAFRHLATELIAGEGQDFEIWNQTQCINIASQLDPSPPFGNVLEARVPRDHLPLSAYFCDSSVSSA